VAAFYEPERSSASASSRPLPEGKKNEIAEWPKVKLEVRERYGKSTTQRAGMALAADRIPQSSTWMRTTARSTPNPYRPRHA